MTRQQTARWRRQLALAASNWTGTVQVLLWVPLIWCALKLLPFRLIARRLGSQGVESPSQTPELAPAARALAQLTNGLCRRLPLNGPCLTQAITIKMLLARRGIATTLYLGVAHEGGRQLKAHAWLRHGERVLCGGRNREAYKVISHFS